MEFTLYKHYSHCIISIKKKQPDRKLRLVVRPMQSCRRALLIFQPLYEETWKISRLFPKTEINTEIELNKYL